MKNLLLASAVLLGLGATSASAVEIGNGFMAGAAGDIHYDFVSEDISLTAVPYFGYTYEGWDLTVSTTLDLQNVSFDGVDFTAEYELSAEATLYGVVSVDAAGQFAGAVAGISFSF